MYDIPMHYNNQWADKPRQRTQKANMPGLSMHKRKPYYPSSCVNAHKVNDNLTFEQRKRKLDKYMLEHPLGFTSNKPSCSLFQHHISIIWTPFFYYQQIFITYTLCFIAKHLFYSTHSFLK